MERGGVKCRIASKGDFFFRTKRGRLFEGGDYFKHCPLEIAQKIWFYYPIKTRKIITYILLGFLKVPNLVL